jgi:hypothetical protein
MTTSPGPSGSSPSGQFARQTRMLSSILVSALVMIGIALSFVLAPVGELPPWWVPLAQVVAGVAMHAVISTIGYQAAPLDRSLSDSQARATAQRIFTTGLTMRFAFSESIAIISIALAFVLQHGGFLIFLGGALVSIVLMALHVWPGAGPVGRIADKLEADGRPSGLREEFGLIGPDPASGSTVQEL